MNGAWDTIALPKDDLVILRKVRVEDRVRRYAGPSINRLIIVDGQDRIYSRKSAANRIRALLVAHPGFGAGHHMWRGGELALWSEWLPCGMFADRGREMVATLPPTKAVTAEILEAVFQAHVLSMILAALRVSTPAALLEWWGGRVASEFRKRIQFPSEVAAHQGGQSLVDTPQVIVGTIHSVKGGQADVVYLFPGLSPARRRPIPPRRIAEGLSDPSVLRGRDQSARDALLVLA